MGAWIIFYISLQLIFLTSLADESSFKNCKKEIINSELSLTCLLKTLNGEFNSSNLPNIDPDEVKSLNLKCSQIHFYQSSIASKSLSKFSKLTNLSIEHCKLSRIPIGTFSGLKNLRNLKIKTHNSAWQVLSLDISPNAFSSVPQLENIDLSGNNLWTLPPKLYCPSASLEKLNLSSNRLQDINVLNFRETYNNKTNSPCRLGIQILDISQNRFITLPPNGFSSLTELKKLILSGNEISVVDKNAFSGLKSLKTLHLEDNKIAKLPVGLFLSNIELAEIHLKNNSLEVLPSNLFSKLDQLVILDLSHNNLSVLVDDDSKSNNTSIFIGLIRLVFLNLSHNKLTRLVSELFKDLYSLQNLNLEHNSIENLNNDIFISLSNLHTLVLSHNKLKSISSNSFNGLFVLSLLSLDNNQISTVHFSAFSNCSSLRDLNLNGNNLTEVPGAVQNLTRLKTIDLGENKIQNLSRPVNLIGLPNLYGLRLTGNKISNLSKDTFFNLPALKVLNLARNVLQVIEEGTFSNNLNLQAVRLDSNYLSDISNLFTSSPSLIWLNISDNQLTSFDYAQIPTQLKWLDLHKNSIQELQNSNFHGNEYKLQTLDVSFNKIEKLGGRDVPDSIEMLFCNDNYITHVEPYIFVAKNNLSRVDLYSNLIEKLDSNSLRIGKFEDERPLPEFYIGGNPLSCDCTMEWLGRIKGLEGTRQYGKIMDMDSLYCRITSGRNEEVYFTTLSQADPSNFLCSYETHCFHLCHCCDFEACDCQMTCPSNCTCYHDDTWNINIVDCSSKSHSFIPLHIPMDATTVYLDNNYLHELHSHGFIARKNLENLYLNSSEIKTIQNNSFSGLKKLQKLHLEDNSLEKIYGFEFEPLVNLKELYLQNNKIYLLANHSFIMLRHLEILNLANNQLKIFAMWNLAENPYLVQISFNFNPWSCNCEFLTKATNWVQLNSLKIYKSESLVCKANVFMKNEIYFNSFNYTECNSLNLGENKTDYIVLFENMSNFMPLLLAAFGILFIMILIFLVSYRKKSSFLLFKLCKFCAKKDSGEDEEKNKLYDLFIFYCAKDEGWVKQVLVSQLTQNENTSLRFLLHHKNFDNNSFIDERLKIEQSVKCSRKTVIVLSKNFTESEWGRFEIRSTLQSLFYRKNNNLIIVTLGDLQTKKMDLDLKSMLSCGIILSTKDKSFWTQLVNLMPKLEILSPSQYSTQTLQSFNYSNGSISKANKNLDSFSPNRLSVFVPPFPPPNRPPPMFPTLKKSSSPHSPFKWA